MKTYRFVIILTWLFFFYLMGLANIPHSKVLQFYTKKNFSFMLPQGWGFFTKDPKDVMMNAYQIMKGGETKLLTTDNTSLSNFLGLSKNNRHVGYELSKLIPHIPKEAWKNGVGILGNNIPDSTTLINTMEEELKNYYAGEEYLLHQFKPIPYAWAGKDQEKHRPYLVARIKIAK